MAVKPLPPERKARHASPPPADKIPFKTRLIGRLLSLLVRALCATLRLKVENESPVRQVLTEGKGLIFATWHGRILIPVHGFRGRGYTVLVSPSRDGELMAEIFRAFDMRSVRGSSGRRGVAATREVLSELQGGGVAVIAPDGPRGPAREAQPGVVYLAQRSGRPIVPGGFAAWPRWHTPTWDDFMVPKPFARASWVYGDPIYIAPDEDLDEACKRIGTVIDSLQEEAERRVRGEGFRPGRK